MQSWSWAVLDINLSQVSGFVKDHQRGQGAWYQENTADASSCATIAVVAFAAVDVTLIGSSGFFTSRVGFFITVSIGSARFNERFAFRGFKVDFHTLIGRHSRAGDTYSFAFIPGLGTTAGHALQTQNWKHTRQRMHRWRWMNFYRY